MENYAVRKPTPPRTDFMERVLSAGAFVCENIAQYSQPHIWFEAKVDARTGVVLDQKEATKNCTPYQWQMHYEYEKRKSIVKSKAEQARTTLTEAIQSDEKNVATMEARLAEVKSQYAKVEQEMQQINDACTSHRHKSRVWFYIASILLLLPDFALQFSAFEQEGLAGWQTGLICGVIAGATGWFAHMFGQAFNDQKRFQMGFIPTLMTVLFGVIAVMRLHNFERVAQELGITIAPEVIALVYFLVNVAIFSIIAMQSIQIHNKEEENCRRKKDVTAKQFEATAKELNDLTTRIAHDQAVLDTNTAKLTASPKDEDAVIKGLEAEFNAKRQAYLKTYTRTARRLGLLT